MEPSALEDDEDIAALKRAAAAKRNKILIGVAAAILLPLAYWGLGFGAVRSSLEENGYTDVKVSAKGPFDYGFEAKKGASECKGTVSRLPFGTSRNEHCYTAVDPSGRPLGPPGKSR